MPTLLRAALLTAMLSPILPAATAFPPVAPPLPESGRAIVNVSTAAQFISAIAAIGSNTTIMLAPGTYHLTSRPMVIGPVSNIAIRGATGNRDDVTLIGDGQRVPSIEDCLEFYDAQDVIIADLSIGAIEDHPIKLNGNAGCARVLVHNCRLFDAGEQFIKGVPTSYGSGVDDGVVEYCLFEYTVAGPADGYTNGIDIHGGARWWIHHNVFRNMQSPAGAPAPGPTILMWNGARDTLCEDNVFVSCHRAIAYGLIQQAGGPDHSGGIIRNNFIFRSASAAGDVSIGHTSSPGTQVLHNTVLQLDGYPNAVEYRFADTMGVVVADNLLNRAIAARDGATGSVSGNLTSAVAGMFLAPASGDLHLLASATVAIDQVAPIATCPTDWDGGARPQGGLADIGADEFGAAGTTGGGSVSGGSSSGSGSGGATSTGTGGGTGTTSPIGANAGGGGGGGSSGCGLGGGLAALVLSGLVPCLRRRRRG